MLNLEKTKKYLLACSFGPDSMALFSMLINEKYDFDVAIVNYHLRKESDAEVDSLKRYCEERFITLYVFDVKEILTKNIEERCREIRYNFFKSLFEKNNYFALLTGHHQDDLIETYFIQKHRQNLPKFYGIAYKTHIFDIDVIRPLLSFKKSDLLDYCHEHKIPYMIDSSNYDTSILRNKYRHEIIDVLTDEKRNELLKEIENKNNELQTMLDSIDTTKTNSVSYLLSLNDKTFNYAVNMISQPLNCNFQFGLKQCDEIKKILMSKKPNIISKIKGKIYIVKEYDDVRFALMPSDTNYAYKVEKRSVIETPYFYFDSTGNTENRNVADKDFPLTIRTYKNEDSYSINGYSVDVKRLFIDWKMPLSVRKIWPIIVSQNGTIIYIPRYRKSFSLTKQCNFFVKIK